MHGGDSETIYQNKCMTLDLAWLLPCLTMTRCISFFNILHMLSCTGMSYIHASDAVEDRLSGPRCMLSGAGYRLAAADSVLT